MGAIMTVGIIRQMPRLSARVGNPPRQNAPAGPSVSSSKWLSSFDPKQVSVAQANKSTHLMRLLGVGLPDARSWRRMGQDPFGASSHVHHTRACSKSLAQWDATGIHAERIGTACGTNNSQVISASNSRLNRPQSICALRGPCKHKAPGD